MSTDLTPYLQGSRIEQYRFELVDFQNRFLGDITNTQGGTLNFNADELIQSAGQLNFIRPEYRDQIDWLKVRVRISFALDGVEPWSLGVYVPSVPEDQFGDGAIKNTITLKDKLTLLDTDKVSQTYYVPRNRKIRDHISSLIQSIGESPSGIQPSEVWTRDEMAWDAGTSKLTIINDLLKAINFTPLHTSGSGIFQARPYTLPTEISPVWEFERGDRAIHKSNYTKLSNLSDIPNKVVLTAEGSTVNDSLTEFWENRELSSPYSIPNRGQTIVHYESGIDAESPAQLKTMAKQRLTELTAPSTILNIEHLVIPLKLHDIISFKSGETDESALEVRRMELTLTPGSLCRTQLKGVVKV